MRHSKSSKAKSKGKGPKNQVTESDTNVPKSNWEKVKQGGSDLWTRLMSQVLPTVDVFTDIAFMISNLYNLYISNEDPNQTQNWRDFKAPKEYGRYFSNMLL